MYHKLGYWVDSDNIIQKVDNGYNSSMNAESGSDHVSSKIYRKPFYFADLILQARLMVIKIAD